MYSGRLDDAISAARKATKISPSFALGHFVLGMGLLFSRRALEAVAPLEYGLRLSPYDGYYNVERMLRRVLSGKRDVLLCGTCMDARGITDAELMEGMRRSTMDELATATAEADKVLIF